MSSCRKNRAHSKESVGKVTPGYKCIPGPGSYIIGHQHTESKHWPAQHYHLSETIPSHEHFPLDRSPFIILSASFHYLFSLRKFSLQVHIYFTGHISFCKFYSTVFYSKNLQIVSIFRLQELDSVAFIIRRHSQKFAFTTNWKIPASFK